MIGPRAIDGKWPARPEASENTPKPRTMAVQFIPSTFDDIRAALAGGIVAVIFMAALIELVLLFRLWAQVTAQEFSGGLLGLVYSLSSALVGPFQSLNETEPIRQTGILDIAILVAIQSYLAIGIMLVAAFWAMRFLVSRWEERKVREAHSRRSQRRRRARAA
jgi:hypothetical protein